MDLTYLQRFCQVVQHKGFSKAGQHLRVGQPTLSRAVRLLEEQLGEVLLTRDKSGIELTPVGRRLYARSRSLFEHYQALEQEFDSKSKLPSIRISVSDNLVVKVIPKILGEFAPNCLFDLAAGTAEEIQRRVINFESHVGYFFNPPTEPNLKCRVLARVPFVLVYSHKCIRKITSFDNLRKLRFIGSRDEDYRSIYFALKALGEHSVQPSEIIQSNSQVAQVELARHGLGYTFVPKFLVSELIESRELRVFSSVTASSPIYEVKTKNPVDQRKLKILSQFSERLASEVVR